MCFKFLFSRGGKYPKGYGVILGFVSERTIKDDNTNIWIMTRMFLSLNHQRGD
jgi:hypothetical protein